ncbi:MAG: tRNA-dihydrouridine synthase family protein [Chitinophagaceae bacterium]|nr:tRNA-dihydrouridine synthase family protein [Oligoflexus sp.]
MKPAVEAIIEQSVISVAPMEGLTTFPMRLWLSIVSQPQSMTTPFLRVTRAFPEREIPSTFAPELYQLRDVLPYTITPQFISGDPEQFLRAADMLPPSIAPILEINCGCPSPNSLGRLAGSGMLHDAESYGRTIERLSAHLGPGRLAVKMRLGIDSPEEFPVLLAAIASLPLARLTIHGRTRADGYRGHARWPLIQRGAEDAQAPVIASGDVLGIESIKTLFREAPSLKGAMIGRGVLRNPWVFTEIRRGHPTEMSLLTFVNALLCYVLIQELWHSHPQKLITRISSGRIGNPCGTDYGAWEKLTVELTAIVFGVPFVLNHGFGLPSDAVSPVAFGRLKILWAYLRSGLPESFAKASIVRSKSLGQFFERLLEAGRELEKPTLPITHQAEWDSLFAGARG